MWREYSITRPSLPVLRSWLEQTISFHNKMCRISNIYHQFILIAKYLREIRIMYMIYICISALLNSEAKLDFALIMKY